MVLFQDIFYEDLKGRKKQSELIFFVWRVLLLSVTSFLTNIILKNLRSKHWLCKPEIQNAFSIATAFIILCLKKYCRPAYNEANWNLQTQVDTFCEKNNQNLLSHNCFLFHMCYLLFLLQCLYWKWLELFSKAIIYQSNEWDDSLLLLCASHLFEFSRNTQKLAMLAFLYCLYLKICNIHVDKSVTSIWIQNILANVNLHRTWFSPQLPPIYIHQKLYKKCQCCQLCVLRENSNLL